MKQETFKRYATWVKSDAFSRRNAPECLRELLACSFAVLRTGTLARLSAVPEG